MKIRNFQIVFFLLLTCSLTAETMISRSCETLRKKLNYPHYYCYCTEESETFQFPQDRMVNDTMWFTASLDDLKQGMTAYWFADCGVTIDVYAFCTSKSPAFSMSVGSNRMTEKDVEDINKKLEEMGDLAGLIGSVLTPHIRVYPHNGGSGHVYCYPYNQGPHSTCEALLPVRTSMTYVSSHADDVYQLEPQAIPESGRIVVQWKEKANQPCLLEIARTCDGEAIESGYLSDSLRVYWIDSTLLKTSKVQNETLYLRFSHAAEHIGRIQFIPDPVIVPRYKDSTVCEGKASLSENGRLYITDTLWTKSNLLAEHGYRLLIHPTDTLYDTISVQTNELAAGYYYEEADTTLYDAGDYQFRIEIPHECTHIIKLHIEETTLTALPISAQKDGGATVLHFDPRKGIYILREGKRYTLLGQLTNQ